MTHPIPRRPCARPGCDHTVLAESGLLFCSLACEEATPEEDVALPLIPDGTGIAKAHYAELPPPEWDEPVEGCHGDA